MNIKFGKKDGFHLAGMFIVIKCAVAFFFLFFLHGTSIGNGQQGISYNGWVYEQVCLAECFKLPINLMANLLIYRVSSSCFHKC
jgi:hypothetical protein